MISSFINTITSSSPLQIYGLQAFAFVISFTNASESMKLVLLLASIMFTIVKTVDIVRKWSNKDKGK
jgi:hypothetical protein